LATIKDSHPAGFRVYGPNGHGFMAEDDGVPVIFCNRAHLVAWNYKPRGRHVIVADLLEIGKNDYQDCLRL